MTATKRRFEKFLFYDYTGIEAHLAKMALKGWQLQQITPFYWQYIKIEPQRLSYAVTYFGEASDFNPFPTENQQTFHEYCKGAGWHLTVEWAQMQIFCTERENPTPMETEEYVKLDAIHRAMKKNFLPGTGLLLLLTLVQIIMQIRWILHNPAYSLANSSTLYAAASSSLLAIYVLTNMLGYASWYVRSKKAISLGGTCIESSSAYQKVYLFLGLLIGILLILAVFSLSSRRLGWVGILGGLNVAVVITGVFLIKATLKRTKASRRVNLSVTIISSVMLSLVLTGVTAWGILRGVNIDRTDNRPAKSYTTTLPDGSLHTWDIYNDSLPLKVEDLENVKYDQYSYEGSANESVLLSHFAAWQNSFPDGQHVPELRYDIVKVKWPALFGFFLNGYLNKYNYGGDVAEEFKRYFRKTDDTAWQADGVYQLQGQDGPIAEYILCWGNQIVNINFEGIPTADQIAVAIKKLNVN